MRRKLIIGNWKMNKNASETKKFFEEFNDRRINLKDNLDYGIAIPFTNIALATILKKESLNLSSQDISKYDKGAHTGEVSASMLKSYDVKYAIIGHSERRTENFETDELVNAKAKQALNNNITPIICVGETLLQYEKNESKSIVTNQVLNSTKGLDLNKIVIAYEPVWAIGTGKTATVEYAQEMCKLIRDLTSQNTIIQYGGSVSPNNINELMSQPDIDGALVGGASLEVDSFIKLIEK